MKTYWVYILKCSDGSYYTGSTSNIEKRVSEHNNGGVKGYTFKRRPVELVFSEYFEDVYDAISAERKIKDWTRVKKEALIRVILSFCINWRNVKMKVIRNITKNNYSSTTLTMTFFYFYYLFMLMSS